MAHMKEMSIVNQGADAEVSLNLGALINAFEVVANTVSSGAQMKCYLLNHLVLYGLGIVRCTDILCLLFVFAVDVH
jgi:hypothetical protein